MRNLVIMKIMTIIQPFWTDGFRYDPERYDVAYEYAYKIKNDIYFLNLLTKAQKKEAKKLVIDFNFFEGLADIAVLNIYEHFHTRYCQQR